MRSAAALLILAASALSASADTIENGVDGAPEVECAAEALTVRFHTQREFEGHVYVKGHFADKGCRVDATLINGVNLTVPFTDCDVRRKRSSNPRGIFLSVTMIISFHPMFITKIDKSYNVECFYTEQEKMVTQQFDVSLNKEQQKKILVLVGDDEMAEKMASDSPNALNRRLHPQSRQQNLTDSSSDYDIYDMTPEVLHGDLPLPVCRYEVLSEGKSGEPVKFATVGQQVYHQWTCEDASHPKGSPFCATVHSCNVKEESGREVQLLDENGCAVDRYLLNNLVYTGDLTGGQVSNVFKFADQPSLFFQCQIRLAVKEGDTCKRSSDNCPLPARGKRSADEEKKDGQEVDVFSQSMTVFEIDDPVSPSAVRELGEAVSAWTSQSMCISPLTFGLLIALLISVLLVSAITVGLLCCRPHTVKVKLAG